MADSLLDRRRMRWLLGFAAWTAFAILSAVHSLMLLERAGSTLPRDQVVIDRLLDWYTCAIFTPLFFWAVRRWPLDRGRPGRSAMALLSTITVATVLKYIIYVPLASRLAPALARGSITDVLGRNFIPELMAFVAMMGVVMAVEYARVARERDARAARLEADLANAQLQALSAQLQPHFLFNTLHGVSALMRRDPDAADTMLTRLADLLRHTLQRQEAEVPLRTEIELLQHYVDIQQIRFGDRLSVRIDTPAELGTALVPRLLLQPLVENALQHGIAVRAGAGQVEVAASTGPNGPPHPELVLTVIDDGPGISSATPAERTGLGITRRRLVVLYGDAARIEYRRGVPGGTIATITLPLRHAMPGAAM